ncbi:MAG: RIP metalloprotease RseP [Chloroflexi bacterium]|jgi:regulator of sigma E protease|nr:RIP metalloprotease RseP [Chloroflexota bacterium]
MTGFISFVVVFSVLIFVHELGHFVAAKLAKVRVEEFGFGYPPRLLKIGQWRETAITINLLPIGGFVRMSEDDPTAEGSLAAKPRKVRALVYTAGALMNLLLAVVLFSITFMVGTWTPVEGQGSGIYLVSPNSPAEAAGLRPGDTIISINGEAIENVDQATQMIGENVGQEIEITVRRENQVLPAVKAVPRVNPPEGDGALGVSLGQPLARKAYPVWEALPMGARATFNMIASIFDGISAIFRKEMPLEVTGVLGIYNMTAEVAKSGIVRLIEFTGFLSINLFLFNLLPLPALDGGRLLFVVLEWVRRGRRVPPEKEGMVHAIGMFVLLALMGVVFVADYIRYFG